MNTYKELLRREITPGRVAALRTERSNADLVDLVVTYGADDIIRPCRSGVAVRDEDHACRLALRYYRLVALAVS